MNNFLKSENCNKSHCKTCIFHPIPENRIHLSESRINEIKHYLSTFESSHICHNTDKTCFGALQFQANILFGLCLIKENSVKSFLDEAQKILKL